jgi:hypothetical protein
MSVFVYYNIGYVLLFFHFYEARSLSTKWTNYTRQSFIEWMANNINQPYPIYLNVKIKKRSSVQVLLELILKC